MYITSRAKKEASYKYKKNKHTIDLHSAEIYNVSRVH